ncbi:autotransporter outer membrane beta-barrel domain-containing protein [Bradyrhizobium sp. 14AA]
MTGAGISVTAAQLTVSGTNSFTATSVTGGIFVNSGTLTSAVGGLTNNAGATFINSGTTNGAVTNSGTFTNAGILFGTLTQSAGVTTNNGTITSNTALSGGTLSGVGTLGNLAVNGGTFAPGNGAPGTSMTVYGSLIFTSAATYLVQVNPATSSFATVAGTAILGGATASTNFAAGASVAKQYTIVTAGLISGTFNPVVANSGLPAGFSTTLSYDTTHAYLNVALNFAPSSGNLNGNQQSVGNGITGNFYSNGSIPVAFGGLTPAGLTQLSGELGSAPQQMTFNAMAQFLGVMTDPFIAGRGDSIGASGAPNTFAEEGIAYAGSGKRRGPARDAFAAYTKAPLAPSFEQRWSVWAAGFGGSQQTDGNAAVGSNTTTSSLYGTAVGADYRLSRDTLLGFVLAGGGTNFSVANNLGGGRSDLFQAGTFFRHNAGPAYITGALAYGWQDIVTNRTVTVAGVDRLRAGFNANAYSGRLEGGYRFVSQGIGLTPYAAAQVTAFDLPAYAEQVIAGSNQFALAYNAKSVTDSRSEIGLRTDKTYAHNDGIFMVRGRFAWAHDFNPNRAIGATFQTLPGASFVVNGAAMASDSALVTASAEKKWLNGWSAAATFEGEFSVVTRSYAGKGVVRYAW